MKTRRSLLGSSTSKSAGVAIFEANHLGIIGPVNEYAVPSKTWLKMAKAVISAYKRYPANRDAGDLERRALESKYFPANFAADDDYSPDGYADELLVRGRRLLSALSSVCIEKAPETATELLDRAIAALHGTSYSTLTKLRASMMK